MKTDLFKQKLTSGDIVVGTMLSEIYTPNIVRMLQMSHYEYLFVDCEHGYFDYTELANIASIGRGFGIKIIVRVPSVQREFITKVLDIGVDGLLLPQIDTPEQAKAAVDFAKYAPLGHRGISTTRAHTGYHVNSVLEYTKQANQDLILLAQIESAEAADNAEKIMSVDGIDGIIIGPNDMAVDLGHTGETFCDDVKANVSKVMKASKITGKPVGIVDGNMQHLAFWKEHGMSIFCIGSELHMLLSGAKANIENFSKL